MLEDKFCTCPRHSKQNARYDMRYDVFRAFIYMTDMTSLTTENYKVNIYLLELFLANELFSIHHILIW